MVAYGLEMDFFIEDNERIWFVNRKTEGLFCVNTDDKTICLVSVIPNGGGYRMYCSGIKHDDKLFFFPYLADNILVYDIKNNMFDKITNDSIQSGMAQYTISICHGNNAIAISTYGEQSILVLNLIDHSLSKVKLNVPRNGIIGRDYEVRDGKIFLTMTDCPVLVEVDLCSFKSKNYEEKKLDEGFGTICGVESGLILTGMHGIYLWDIDSDKIDILTKYPSYIGVYDKSGNYNEGFDKNVANYIQPFWKSYVVNSKVYIVSAVVNTSLVFDWLDKSFNAIDLEDSEDIETKEEYPFNKRASIIKHIATLQIGDTIVYSTTRDKSIRIFHCSTDTRKELVMELPLEDRLKLVSCKATTEGDLLSLEEWIGKVICQ